MRTRVPTLAFLISAMLPLSLLAQDAHIRAPIADVERVLREGEFSVLQVVQSRGLPAERTYQITIQSPELGIHQVKFAPAPRGGGAFNNRPRYEIAAYELQKLFLDEADYVVPPTVGRCFTFAWVQDVVAKAPGNPNPPEKTFREWDMTLSALQYWLWGVETAEQNVIRDRDRAEEDEVFAKHTGNFNILTYLIRHNDSNVGNFMISQDPSNPRIFAVDNGLAFSSDEESNRGTYWRDLKMERYPQSTIERLRALTEEELHAKLGVLAQFEVRGGEVVAVEPTENLDPGDGIRRTDTVLQLGLTDREIRQVYDRMERLIRWMDDGRYETF